MADGAIIIDTTLRTDDLESELKKVESDLKKYEREVAKLTDKKAELEIKVKAETSEYEKQIADLKARYNDELGFIKDAGNGNIPKTTQMRIDEKYQTELDGINQKYRVQSNELDKINSKLNENYKKQADLKEKVSEINVEMSRRQYLEETKGKMQDIGASLSNILGKVVRWGFYLFSIRSAYSLISSAVSTLSSYNTQIGTDIAYIRFALASTLQPIVEGLIKLIYKLLVYTAYIVKAWFGINLFANASTTAFQKTNKAVKETNKSAKELQKTLTGFDEMNVLQKNGDVTSGGGGGGIGDITAPSIDLSEWENVEIPKWIDWIAKNKDLILKFLLGVAAFFATVKIAQFLGNLFGIFKNLQGITGLKLWGAIAGFAVTLVGIFQTVSSIIKFIKDPSWENFVSILQGISTILVGIGITLISINASNPLGWIMLLIGAIGSLVTWLLKEESQANKTLEAENRLKEARKKVAEATDEYVNAVDNAEQAEKNLKDAEEKHQLSGQALYDMVKEGTLDYKNMNAEQREVYKAYLQNKEAQNKLTDSRKKLNQATKEELYSDLNVKLSKAQQKKDYSDLKKAIVDYATNGKAKTKDLAEYMQFAMLEMDNKSKETFTQNLPSDLQKAFDESNYMPKLNNFVSSFNGAISRLTKNITLSFGIGGNISKLKSLFGFAKGGIVVPRLASGGIINMPNRGVPIGRAIGGEAGAEGVIPLTDSQQMALLGEAIGKHININTTVPVYVGNRQIAREIKRINAEDDFAYNR